MQPQLFSSLKSYKKSYLWKDLFAGLMVAIIALPLSIALGIQSVPDGVSSHGIQYGIITAIVAGFFISALGGSRFQIGGPTAAFVVILFGYLADPNIGVLGLAIAAMMAGVLLMIMGFCRVGSVMKFFPYPITIGFTTGIGVTLLIGQIKDWCGFTASGTEAIEKLVSYCKNIGTFHPATFFVGAIGLACVFVLPRINKKIPAAFAALIVCTLVTLLLNQGFDLNVATIGSKYGDIQAEFYPLDFSNLRSLDFGALIVPALVIAFLCAIESLLSATVASGMTNTTFDSNQELVGQGVANICSALLGGLPATGAIARTAAGIENGAKSPLCGVFHALFLLLMYFALMEVLQYIPLAVFSAILISVAYNMSRFRLFAKLSAFGIRDSIILFVTFALTVIFDLTYGVLGGVAVTLLLNIQNFKTGLTLTVTDGEIPTITPKGTLFFCNAHRLGQTLERTFASHDCVRLDLSQTKRIDETALEKLAACRKKLRKANKELQITGENEKISPRMQKFLTVL